ncbi:MAG: hypothetical protein HY763_17285 [Planctomycetes bacterium]|nr:hypothetical protein [Planctomycetota bacterium]
MTPDGLTLLAVNTPDARLEAFDLESGTPVWIDSIPVGLEPVSVRVRGNGEAWVVNHISDSVSVVSLTTGNVAATIRTLDEPADVVFAGTPQRAFVTCSQANTVQVLDPADLDAGPIDIPIDAEDPRALAVSPDGRTVYAAIFESGNGTTILGGGAIPEPGIFPPNVVSDPLGPYGGVNPPPNAGAAYNPPMNPLNPPPPPVGLIVRKDGNGNWMDDNCRDWTDFVTGPLAHLSGRLEGWDLPDRDLAVIDAQSLQLTYARRLMNLCMALAVHPTSGEVTVVGTDGINDVRFLSNLAGRFLRVQFARVAPGADLPHAITDLNPHLTYQGPTVPRAQRDLSVGDPRGIIWAGDGLRGYVSGMGSNNVVVIDASGDRAGLSPTIEVGEGPTGLALDEPRQRLYVLNRFAASVSVVDTAGEVEIARVPFFDPTPAVIRVGRRHLYDTHETSGLGHVACASCHADARPDRLAWDLGEPDGDMKTFNQNCGANLFDEPCEDHHPMKGPMITQTLQDIIGKEPLHWRGDRDGLEEFNPAFEAVLGDDETLTAEEMQELKAFLATITFGPNPFRNLDNSLPTDLPLPGHHATGLVGPAGLPLPNGNAAHGLDLYRTGKLFGGAFDCVTCHTLPTGAGTNLHAIGGQFAAVPAGPNGENHLMIVSFIGTTNISMKVPSLRNDYERTGFDQTQLSNRAGFGYLNDGAVDSIARMISVFSVQSVQDLADLVAFVLSISGSDLPVGGASNPYELRGPDSKDTHAGVGVQVTVDGANRTDAGVLARIEQMRGISQSGAVGMIAKALRGGERRGYYLVPPATMHSDRAGELMTMDALRTEAGAGAEVTFTLVPAGSEVRFGVDRDEDGAFDRDELDACANPADRLSTPANVVITGDSNGDGAVAAEDLAMFTRCATGPALGASLSCACWFDFDRAGHVDLADFQRLQLVYCGATCP